MRMSLFVVDVNNRRVLLLSPSLTFVRQVVSRDQFTGQPLRVHVHVNRQHLYVADDVWKDGKCSEGRVVVFSV